MTILQSKVFGVGRNALHRLARPRWLAGWFVLCVLPAGLGCALLTPIGMVSDEFAHLARADALRHGEIYGARPPPGYPASYIQAGVMLDNAMLGVLASHEFGDALPDRPVPAADRVEAAAVPWFAGVAFFPCQMVEYFPVMYVPGTLGLVAGKSVGLTPLHTFYLGRVCMLLAYVAMGTAAIGLARFGNILLFAVLSLPTAVNLAASYNQDGMIIGACGLAAALLTRGRGKSWYGALALLAAAILAKSPYVALFGLCLPPIWAPGTRQPAPELWRRAGLVLLACALPALWRLSNGLITYHCTAYQPGPLWPGPRDIWLHEIAPGYNEKVLLAHPAQILRLPLTSVAGRGYDIWRHMLGIISWDDVLIWGWEYPCLLLALGAAALGSACGGRSKLRGLDAGLTILALCLAFIGVELAMYITATRAGMAAIDGVQARYFLPLLPFLIFPLPFAGGLLARLPGAAALAGIAPGWFALPAVSIALVNAYVLPEFVYHVFRMPGP